MLTTPPTFGNISWCFRSQFIFAGRDPKILTAAAKVENLTVFFHGSMSISRLHDQTSTSQHYGRTPTLQHRGRTPASQHHDQNLTKSFSKILQILSPSLPGMTSSTLQPISCLRFIMIIVIVISFARERKLHLLTTHLNP